MPYFINETPEFLADLRGIDGNSGLLAGLLQEGLYFALRRDPHQGTLLRSGLWVLRQRHLAPLAILVTYYYRIHEEAGQVEMVAAKLTTAI